MIHPDKPEQGAAQECGRQGEESDSANLVKVRDSIYTGRNSK
ncbi:MAG: hypothetical protein ACOX8K_14405 [Lachnospiraceae bacterium]|jgi:hypothetical protein